MREHNLYIAALVSVFAMAGCTQQPTLNKEKGIVITPAFHDDEYLIHCNCHDGHEIYHMEDGNAVVIGTAVGGELETDLTGTFAIMHDGEYIQYTAPELPSSLDAIQVYGPESYEWGSTSNNGYTLYRLSTEEKGRLAVYIPNELGVMAVGWGERHETAEGMVYFPNYSTTYLIEKDDSMDNTDSTESGASSEAVVETEKAEESVAEITASAETDPKETTALETKPQTTTAVPETKPTEPTTTAHEHSFRESKRAAATCTTAGSITYSCSCGQTKSQAIPATGHSWTVTTEAPANCVTAGTRTSKCTSCGETKTETTTPATGAHNWTIIAETPANCVAAGTRTLQCSVCGTQTAENTTSATGAHNWTIIAETPANCVAAGTRTLQCSVCGTQTAENTTPATGVHNWVLIGQDVNLTYQCSVCSQTRTELNPNYVSYRAATADEVAAAYAEIVAERRKNGLGELAGYTMGGAGAQAWAEYEAKNEWCGHDESYNGNEGVGYDYVPSFSGQCYTCLGLAVVDGFDYYAGRTLHIGMAYSTVTGRYYYCVRVDS